LGREVLAGLVVALATIPTSVAYSSVIGVSPLVGIWSSAIVGGIVALVGGGPGIIAGASGVVAPSIARIVASHGTAYMGASVILAAILESFVGIARLGKKMHVCIYSCMTVNVNVNNIYIYI
jgi:SulP family sulfate permease